MRNSPSVVGPDSDSGPASFGIIFNKLFVPEVVMLNLFVRNSPLVVGWDGWLDSESGTTS